MTTGRINQVAVRSTKLLALRLTSTAPFGCACCLRVDTLTQTSHGSSQLLRNHNSPVGPISRRSHCSTQQVRSASNTAEHDHDSKAGEPPQHSSSKRALL